MADSINHANVEEFSSLVNAKLHKDCDPSSSYFTKQKFMCDLSSLLATPQDTVLTNLNVCGHIN